MKYLSIAAMFGIFLFVAYSFQKTPPQKRFFLISYSVQAGENGTKTGDFPCEVVAGFPSKLNIAKKVAEFTGLPATYKNVVVTNIFEFKSKQDYLHYNHSEQIGQAKE